MEAHPTTSRHSQPVNSFRGRLTLLALVAASALATLAAQTVPESVKPPEEGSRPALWGSFGPIELEPEVAAELQAARVAIREDFFEAANHVRLARAYREAGAPLLAFRIIFFAQTRHFSPADLIRAYRMEMGSATSLEEPRSLVDSLAAAEQAVGERAGDADAWRDYGRVLLRVPDRQEEGMNALRHAIEIDPDHGPAHASLAAGLARRGAAEAAARMLEAFLETHPGNLDASVELADLVRASDFSRARGIIRGALKEHPDAAQLHFSLAYLTTGVGEPSASLYSYQRACELDPGNPVYLAWWARAELLEKDDRSRALDLYLKAWFRDPYVREATEVYKRITSIMEDEAATALGMLATSDEARSHFDDLNPLVALGSWSHVLDDEECSAPILQIAYRQLSHDEESVRFQAARYIAERAPAEEDSKIRALANSDDPFVAGLMMYIHVIRWGQQAKGALSRSLQSTIEYLRFEALSALSELGGGWGLEMIEAHLLGETSERLRRIFGRKR